jgi:hypothetical protein
MSVNERVFIDLHLSEEKNPGKIKNLPRPHFTRRTTRKKHSCQNGLKLLPAQFFLPYEQDFPTEIAGKPVFLLLELENPAHMAGKIELEVISSHFGRNVFSLQCTPNQKFHSRSKHTRGPT